MASLPNAMRIRTALENAIVEGRHPPGSRLDPEALAQEFSCSRTPIREALQQLEASGLVKVAPKRGTFVSEWTLEELTERFELMAEMEAFCGGLAARRITRAEMVELERLHERCGECAESGEAEAYYARNSEFHHHIYRAAHNAFLTHEASRLHAMLQPYRRMQLKALHRMARSYAEHGEILAAIRAGDAEEAARVLRGHVIIQGDRFHDLIAALRKAREQASP